MGFVVRHPRATGTVLVPHRLYERFVFEAVLFPLCRFLCGEGGCCRFRFGFSPVHFLTKESQHRIAFRNGAGEVGFVLEEQGIDPPTGDSDDIHYVGKFCRVDVALVGKLIAEVQDVVVAERFLGGIRSHGEEIRAEGVKVFNLGAGGDSGAGNIFDDTGVEKRLDDTPSPFVGDGNEILESIAIAGADGAAAGVCCVCHNKPPFL